MDYQKRSRRKWYVNAIVILLIHGFIIGNMGLAFGSSTVETNYLAPALYVNSDLLRSVVSSSISKNIPEQILDILKTPQTTGLDTKNYYLQQLRRLKNKKYIQPLNNGERDKLRFNLNDKRKITYLDAIAAELKKDSEAVVFCDLYKDYLGK